MPRRISDYPDAFAGWNLISSIGSLVSVVATALFLHIVYLQLVEGKSSARYPWYTPEFFSDYLQIILRRSFESMEWALNSPPKPHPFISLPLTNDQWTIAIQCIIGAYNSFPYAVSLETLLSVIRYTGLIEPLEVFFFQNGIHAGTIVTNEVLHQMLALLGYYC